MTTVDIGDIARDVTVTISVSGVKAFRVRLWLASWVLRFGVWIIGMNAEIEIKS